MGSRLTVVFVLALLSLARAEAAQSSSMLRGPWIEAPFVPVIQNHTNRLEIASTAGLVSMSSSSGQTAVKARLQSLVVRGEDAGMVCNDVVDDGPNFQNALNMAIGRILLLPANAYCRIKSYVTWPSNVRVIGQRTQINFDATAKGGGAMSVTMDMVNVSDVIIEDITFNGPGAKATNQVPRFIANNVSRVRIKRSIFQNFGNTTNVDTIAATYAHGLLFFVADDVVVENSRFQYNAGDGLSFSNNSKHTRVLNNTFISNYDSAIVPCTIGGTDNQVIGNVIVGSSIPAFPLIVIDRCQHNVVAFNTIIGAPGANCVRIARYVDTLDVNQGNKIIGNSCYGGTKISVEASGSRQGTQSVPQGGMFVVRENTIVAPVGAGISVSDSTNGFVEGNRIIRSDAEGIVEISYTSNTGNNQFRNNFIDGATYCLRSFESGGKLTKSIWINNIATNCSLTKSSLANDAGADIASTP